MFISHTDLVIVIGLHSELTKELSLNVSMITNPAAHFITVAREYYPSLESISR